MSYSDRARRSTVVHHLVERSPVLDEGPHFRTRRQTAQVEVKATNQGYSVSIRSSNCFSLSLAKTNRSIQWSDHSLPVAGTGFLGARRPNIFILRLENPLLDDFALLGFITLWASGGGMISLDPYWRCGPLAFSKLPGTKAGNLRGRGWLPLVSRRRSAFRS